MIIQGELGTTNTIIAQNGPVYNEDLSTVNTLRFRNASAYILTVSRYSKKSNRTDIIYQYTLSGGDTVLDMSNYILEFGDILYAKSNISGTTYTAMTF
jgi:hypothetical protein